MLRITSFSYIIFVYNIQNDDIYPAAKYYLTTLIWTLKEKLCNPWTILQNVNKRSSRWPRCDKNWYNGTHGMHVVQIEKGGIKMIRISWISIWYRPNLQFYSIFQRMGKILRHEKNSRSNLWEIWRVSTRIREMRKLINRLK